MTEQVYEWLGECTAYALELDDSVEAARNGNKAKLLIKRNGLHVSIAGEVHSRQLTVRFSYRITGEFEVTQDEIQSFAPGGSVSPDEAAREVRKQKLGDIDSKEREAAEQKVGERLSESDLRGFKLTTKHPDLWDGFEVETTIYPSENEFGIEEYDQVVHEVRSQGRLILTDIYNHIDALGGSPAPEVSEAPEKPDRTFQ